MSILDQAGATTPLESDEARSEATRRARLAAGAGDWLSLALDHHDMLRDAFEECGTAADAARRTAALRRLALVLNGHSLAEEVVLYPALAKAGGKTPAGMAYAEQSAAKMQMAELERIDPNSPEWLEKLEHVRRAVLHHLYEEEDSWFVKLKEEYPDQAFLTLRFREEYERYARGAEAEGRVAGEARTFDELTGSGSLI